MSRDYSKTGNTKSGMVILRGMIMGVLVTAAAMLIFAVLMLVFEVDRRFAVPFSTVSIALGTFFAALFAARRIGDKGYLIGLIVGGLTFAVITLVSLFLSKNGLSYNTLFHFVIMLLSSLIGGIWGVNRKKTQKYI